MKRLALTLIGALAVACAIALPAAAQDEALGLHELDASFHAASGALETQAGAHPFSFDVNLAVNTKTNPETSVQVPVGELKDVSVSLPPGLVGKPNAVPRCSTAQFVKKACPNASQIGIAHVQYGEGGNIVEEGKELYDLEPSPGTVAKIGFVVQVVPVTVDLSVNPNPPYNVIATSPNASQTLFVYAVKLTIWGDPASAIHDKERGVCVASASSSCPANVANVPFLTMPTVCDGALKTTFVADFWRRPGSVLSNGEPDLSDPNWFRETIETHDTLEPPNPLGLSGCERLAFDPTITSKPTSLGAAGPTGLDFDLQVGDEGLTAPEGHSASDVRKAIVTLPEGMTANPSLAEGLSVCNEEQLAHETAGSLAGEGCPQESKIGTIEVQTPLLDEPLTGSMFIAKPYANPFGSLLAVYFVIKSPTLGIVIKQSAEIVPDPVTGRLTTVVEGIPQLPFSHFKLHFREGGRSPLVTPPTCGAYQVGAQLFPWSGARPVDTSSTFQVIAGPAGGPCPAGGTPPFAPSLIAGTLNNSAGSHSSLDIRITRNDGEQEITGFSSVLPLGLSADLTGVPFCSEAQIAQAKGKTGAEEQAGPSCPQASEIGHTLVGVGVGPALAYAPGKLYMAGPFDGAPFSVVAVTSAMVGPFDLGTVVVHLPLDIDPVTAQISIPQGAADQIPHIVKGIVVHVRDVRVYVDRPDFMLNPTDCDPLSLTAVVFGAGRDLASPADDVSSSTRDRFQAADCAHLTFKPSFEAATNGRTSRTDGASLTVKLAFPKAPVDTQARVRSVRVSLPKQLPSRLSTLQQACPDAVFAANPATCPPGSRVGIAKAVTPILPVPLKGPAYFVSHGGSKWPELILVLQGYGVTIDLHGETFISKHGITSSTFKSVPDQPVTSFQLTLPQGPNSALSANRNLCTKSLKMPTTITAQNGAVVKQSTPVAVQGCARHKAKHGHRKKGHGRARRHRR